MVLYLKKSAQTSSIPGPYLGESIVDFGTYTHCLPSCSLLYLYFLKHLLSAHCLPVTTLHERYSYLNKTLLLTLSLVGKTER
jgi:hypothetical protein